MILVVLGAPGLVQHLVRLSVGPFGSGARLVSVCPFGRVASVARLRLCHLAAWPHLASPRLSPFYPDSVPAGAALPNPTRVERCERLVTSIESSISSSEMNHFLKANQ